jgi:hypothetical protein
MKEKQMRYITIPKPETVIQNGNAKLYYFATLLVQIVWVHEAWRTDATKHAMMFTLVEKFDGAEPGDVVALTDKEYEVFEPIATMQGQKLNHEAAVPLNKLMGAVIQASTLSPDEQVNAKENAAKALDALKEHAN